MKTDFATNFKNENAGKWIWFNGAMNLDAALLNYNIEDSRETAVQRMANRDGVSYDEVDNNYKDWYYITPVEEIEDDSLNEHGSKYWVEIIEDGNSVWQRK